MTNEFAYTRLYMCMCMFQNSKLPILSRAGFETHCSSFSTMSMNKCSSENNGSQERKCNVRSQRVDGV